MSKKIRTLFSVQIEWALRRERYNPRAYAAVRQGARKDLARCRDPIRYSSPAAAQSQQSLTGRRACSSNSSDSRLPTVRCASPKTSHVETENSNSTALVDGDYLRKGVPEAEIAQPSIEVGVLTDVAGFANAPALLAR